MKAAGYSGGKVRISQTENEALAALVCDEILKEYPNTDIKITAVRGLCAFYCERGGIVVSCET